MSSMKLRDYVTNRLFSSPTDHKQIRRKRTRMVVGIQQSTAEGLRAQEPALDVSACHSKTKRVGGGRR